MNSTTAADFEAYLGQFPDGVYRALAANRLRALRAAAGDPDRPRPAEPGSLFRDCEGCPEMVVVPAGRFRMGCVSGRNCSNNELPVHDMSMESFALSKYEVTFDEYDRFARATGGGRSGAGSAPTFLAHLTPPGSDTSPNLRWAGPHPDIQSLARLRPKHSATRRP